MRILNRYVMRLIFPSVIFIENRCGPKFNCNYDNALNRYPGFIVHGCRIFILEKTRQLSMSWNIEVVISYTLIIWFHISLSKIEFVNIIWRCLYLAISIIFSWYILMVCNIPVIDMKSEFSVTPFSELSLEFYWSSKYF